MSYIGKVDLFDANGKIKAEDLPETTGRSSNGLSAYELAIQEGFIGTLQQWLDSLQGKNGSDALVTKANVEAVLTGEITTHTHPSLGGLTQQQIFNLQ